MASGKRENDGRSCDLADPKEEVDAVALQFENQKLVQQLEAQKTEMHTLEGKFKELNDDQISYDKTLIALNKIWNQLVDDLVLLGVRAGGNPNGLQALDNEDLSPDTIESCPPEQMFLCQLLQAGRIEDDASKGIIKNVQAALDIRLSWTINLMKNLQETIAAQRAKTESIVLSLRGRLSSEDAILQLQKLNDSLMEEAGNLRQAIEIIHEKHKQFSDEINTYLVSHPRDQSEIKRLSGSDIASISYPLFLQACTYSIFQLTSFVLPNSIALASIKILTEQFLRESSFHPICVSNSISLIQPPSDLCNFQFQSVSSKAKYESSFSGGGEPVDACLSGLFRTRSRDSVGSWFSIY